MIQDDGFVIKYSKINEKYLIHIVFVLYYLLILIEQK